MATEWRKAPDHVLDIVRRLIDLYHEPLKEARIGVIMRSEAPRTGGKIVYGKAEKVSPKAQVHVPYDFIIWLAQDQYGLLAPLQREALIDHELCHCQWLDDSASIRPHDVEEFTEILERYGYWWPRAEEFAAAAQQAQLFEEQRGGLIAIATDFAAQFLRSPAEALPPGARVEMGDSQPTASADDGDIFAQHDTGSTDDNTPTGETIDDVLAGRERDGDESEGTE